jgi:uncharacterized membrane protein YbhN (UPF0104 family)
VVAAAFFAARALDLDHVGMTALMAFVPAVAIVQVVPISLGGLGIREGALVLFLHPLHVTTGRAVALGLLERRRGSPPSPSRRWRSTGSPRSTS